jgi:hypothetical protein
VTSSFCAAVILVAATAVNDTRTLSSFHVNPQFASARTGVCGGGESFTHPTPIMRLQNGSVFVGYN